MTILKGIPRLLPPQLLYTLARMGHGDTLVIADANFPAASVAAHTPAGLINCDGSGAPAVLKAILSLLPLDPVVTPCQLMAVMPEHKAAGWKTPIWCVALRWCSVSVSPYHSHHTITPHPPTHNWQGDVQEHCGRGGGARRHV